jgi:hypothetical protein
MALPALGGWLVDLTRPPALFALAACFGGLAWRLADRLPLLAPASPAPAPGREGDALRA